VVAFKNAMNATIGLTKLGVDSELLGWLAGSGVVAKLTAEFWAFSHPELLAIVQVPVTVALLTKLAQDGLSGFEKSQLKFQVETAIKKIKSALLGIIQSKLTLEEALVKIMVQPTHADSGFPSLTAGPPVPLSTLGKLPPLPSAIFAPPLTLTVTPWSTFPALHMKTATPVKLRDATQMYQPVRGTSADSSRYYVVAANKDLRIAARLESGTLSVRIEGPGWEKHKAKIAACGFSTIKPKEGYASLHLGVGPDAMLAGKTLGAVLMGLGLEMQTPLPNLKLIAG